MYQFEILGVSWPPHGWEELSSINSFEGQAVAKNPQSAKVTGIDYIIEPVPTYCQDRNSKLVYQLQIKGWEYNIYNESSEYAVLSFTLHDRCNIDRPKYHYMSEIKVMAQNLRLTERSAQRSYMAALFLVKQIIAGQVPDIDRILKLYKIHPTQNHVYSISQKGRDPLCCNVSERHFSSDKTEIS